MPLEQMLRQAIAEGAQNLHVSSDRRVKVRVSGLFLDLGEIDDADFDAFTVRIHDDRNRAELRKSGSTTAMTLVDGVVVRAHVYYSGGKPVAAVRFHRDEIGSAEELGIPQDIVNLTDAGAGWVLFSGPQSSGKTTTTACLTRYIAENATIPRHVVTVERPVEFRIISDSGLVTPMEIPTDAPNLPAALRSIVRSDAQVGVIGELRMEAESAAAFVDLVDAGLLVLANTHGSDPVRAIDRVLDSLAPEDRERGRRIMAHGMVASVALQLVRDNADRLVLVTSVLHASNMATQAILDGDLGRLYALLDSPPNRSFAQALEPMIPGQISRETAERALRAADPSRA